MATVAPESAMAGLDPMFQPEWFLDGEQLALLEPGPGEIGGDDQRHPRQQRKQERA